jgi:hypothetical protein
VRSTGNWSGDSRGPVTDNMGPLYCVYSALHCSLAIVISSSMVVLHVVDLDQSLPHLTSTVDLTTVLFTWTGFSGLTKGKVKKKCMRYFAFV